MKAFCIRKHGRKRVLKNPFRGRKRSTRGLGPNVNVLEIKYRKTCMEVKRNRQLTKPDSVEIKSRSSRVFGNREYFYLLCWLGPTR